MYLLLISLAASANDAVLSAAASALDKGQPKIALQLLEKELETDPFDQDVNLLAGTAFTRIGNYSDAMEHFEYGDGARGSNHKYIEFYADTLRVYGHGDKAADVRMGLIMVGELPEGANIRIYSAIIDDYRSIGELHKAHQVLHLLQSQFPNSLLGHVMSAELALDENKIDDALSHLALIDSAPRLWRFNAVKARIEYLDQCYQAAYDLSFRFGRSRMPSQAVSLRLQAARMANDPEETFHVLQRQTWKGHEAPEFLLSEMVALADMEQFTKAEEVGRYLQVMYPDNRSYYDAVNHLLQQFPER